MQARYHLLPTFGIPTRLDYRYVASSRFRIHGGSQYFENNSVCFRRLIVSEYKRRCVIFGALASCTLSGKPGSTTTTSWNRFGWLRTVTKFSSWPSRQHSFPRPKNASYAHTGSSVPALLTRKQTSPPPFRTMASSRWPHGVELCIAFSSAAMGQSGIPRNKVCC
jgi:hypothetical protein